jgi:hypothetical protein
MLLVWFSKSSSTFWDISYLPQHGFLPDLFVDSEDVGGMFLKISVDFQATAQYYITEDITLHNHRCENLKSYFLDSNLI